MTVVDLHIRWAWVPADVFVVALSVHRRESGSRHLLLSPVSESGTTRTDERVAAARNLSMTRGSSASEWKC
jgi:hypothetical protein